MAVSARRLRLIVLVIVTALILGWRFWQQPRPAGAPRATTAAASVTTWRVGSLSFAPCTIGKANTQSGVAAWCTRYEVPENRSQPGGRRIALRVAVIRSAAEQPLGDWLVFLDGGPGGAATDDYPQLQGALADSARRRHVLLIDQRGTGGSNALSCEEEPKLSAGDEGHAALRARPVDAQLTGWLKRCMDKLNAKANPAQYTTGTASDDLEAVRQALGAPQLNLIGVSYGTRVAQQYARAYPAAVRSVVLDSAVPNSLFLPTEHAQNLDASLKAQFARCTAEPACKERFGDPFAAMHELRRRLRQHPVAAEARDPLTHAPFTRSYGAADLAATVRLLAYSPLTAALLPLGFDEALKGNITPLVSQEKLIIDGITEQLTDGMGLSVACAEDVDGLRHNPADEETMLANSLVDFLIRTCQTWPHGTRRSDFHAPFHSTAPVLVLAGEFDPVTPVRYGEEIVRSLTNARLLKVKGRGHGVIGAGCMPRLLSQFLDDLQPAKLDAGCLERLGYVPAFLGYSGAAP